MNSFSTIVNEIFDLYQEHGREAYYGEPVSQLEHMSQSAQLAIQEGHDDVLILAAFFHDIGHLCSKITNENSMGEFGVVRHEKIGADFLRAKGFPEIIARLVENHVQAKRYLTFRYPSYYHQLSVASKETLRLQGGPMSAVEAEVFERDLLFEKSLLLRKWDELAKIPGLPLIDLELLKLKTVNLLENHTSRL